MQIEHAEGVGDIDRGSPPIGTSLRTNGAARMFSVPALREIARLPALTQVDVPSKERRAVFVRA
jgi:hypothetical protein